MTMSAISYKWDRFSPQIISHAVWLCCRFPLGLRRVDQMLMERGIVVSYETIRRWGRTFGVDSACRLRFKQRGRDGGTWMTSSSSLPAGALLPLILHRQVTPSTPGIAMSYCDCGAETRADLHRNSCTSGDSSLVSSCWGRYGPP